MMTPSLRAYRGSEPFLFVSYAHLDADTVLPILLQLHQRGVRIYFDEGLQAGLPWELGLGEAIEHCSCFVVFLTENSVQRPNVLNEISMAVNKLTHLPLGKPSWQLIPIYLESFVLPPELQLSIGRLEAIFQENLSQNLFIPEILNHLPPSVKVHSDQKAKSSYLSTLEPKGITIHSINDLEELWKDNLRPFYFREAHRRGVDNLSDFWKNKCIPEIWALPPADILNCINENMIIFLIAQSGNGKTMCLLTIAKECIESSSLSASCANDITFLKYNAFHDEAQYEIYKNHIILCDLPSAENAEKFANTIECAINHQCKLIITLYPNQYELIYRTLAAKIGSTQNIERIDLDENFWGLDSTKQDKALLALITRWHVKLAPELSKTEALQLIKAEIQRKNRFQIVMFLKKNLDTGRPDFVLTKEKIANFVSDYDQSAKFLLSHIPPQFYDNLRNLVFQILGYLNWLKNGYDHLKLTENHFGVNLKGFVPLIIHHVGLNTYLNTLYSVPLFDYQGDELKKFDPSGTGAQILRIIWKKAFGEPFDPMGFHITDEHVFSILKTGFECESQKEFKIETQGLLLDLLRGFMGTQQNPMLSARIIEKLNQSKYGNIKTKQDFFCEILRKIPKSTIQEQTKLPIEQQKIVQIICEIAEIDPDPSFYYKKILETYPKLISVWNKLGTLLGKTNVDESIKVFRSILDFNPKDCATWINLSLSLDKKGDKPGTIDALNHAIECDPENSRAWFNLGYFHGKQGDHDKAFIAFSRVTKIDPDDDIAWFNQGLSLENKGDIVGAINAFRQAIKIDPKNTDAWINLGIQLGNKGNHEGAVDSFQHVIEHDPKNVVATYNLGIGFKQLKKLDEAIKHFRRTIELDGKQVHAWFELGLCLREIEDYDGAIEAFRQVIEQDPKSVNSWLNLGICLKQQGDVDGAIAAYRRIIEIDPKYVRAWFNLAIDLRAKQDLEGALTSINRALEIDPKYVDGWFLLGIYLKDKGDIDSAIIAYRKVIELNPKHVDSMINLGIIIREKGDIKTAIDIFQKAAEIEPEKTNTLFNLGICFNLNGDLDGSIAIYRRLLSIDDKTVSAWFNLGISLKDKGDINSAIDAIRKAVEIDPKFERAWYNLGGLLKKVGDLKGALDAYRHATDINPSFKEAWFNIGPILTELHDIDGAIIIYKKVIEIDSKFLEAWNNLGVIYLNKEQWDEARNAFEMILQFEPENGSAVYNLACLAGLQNNLQMAVEFLARAITINIKYKKLAANDKDFDLVRHNPAFQALIANEPKEG